MIKNKIFILVILLFFVTCCANRQREESILSKEKDSFKLLGKKVASVDSILPYQKNKTVFLFNYYDCGSCVDAGFLITKRIDSLYGGQRVYIVSTMGDPLYYQKRNSYDYYVYLDSKDLIRKELKYIQTPIVILFDSANYVQDYIFPNVSDSGEITSFIKSTVSGCLPAFTKESYKK